MIQVMMKSYCTLFVFMLVLSCAIPSFSNEENEEPVSAERVEEIKAAVEADKTGTNPINFTHDLRFYNEFIWLNTEGNSYQNVTTLEYRQPFASDKWQFRTRIRGTGIELDLNDDGADDFKEWGLGEIDFRLLTVPWLDMKRLQAIALGLETFLPTAEDGLGSKRLTFGPQIFWAKFNPFGAKGWLFAPGYQHRFSVWEDDDLDTLHQSVIDLYVVWLSSNKQYWSLLDPQIILDWQEEESYMILDWELGMMLDKYTGSKGHSIYIRPSVGVGGDRPTDGSIEVGYKIVW